MQGSDSIYIVMPVVVILCLGVLIALPFLGTRDSGGSRGDTSQPGGRKEQQAMSESPAHQGAAAAITYPDSGDPPSDDGGAQLTSAP